MREILKVLAPSERDAMYELRAAALRAAAAYDAAMRAFGTGAPGEKFDGQAFYREAEEKAPNGKNRVAEVTP